MVELTIELTTKGTIAAVKKMLGAGWEAKGAKKKGYVLAESPAVEANGFTVPQALAGLSKLREDVDKATFDVKFPDTAHTQTLIKRAGRELGHLGVENSKHKFFFSGDGDAVANVAVVLLLMAERANRKVTITEHALTWYDFKQALGLVDAVSRGDKKAMALAKWADAVQIEYRKAELAAMDDGGAKAKARKARAAKINKAAKKTKPKGKAKPTKAASLSPRGFEDE